MKNYIKYLSIFTVISLISISCEAVQTDNKLSENSKTYEKVWAQFFDQRDMDVINSQYFTEDVKVVIPGD
jgi:translation elongation factor P/translation initiation factor 5A